MMTNCLRLLLLITIVFNFNPLSASHYSGGEIYWEKLSNDSFQITMVVYRDCKGIGDKNLDCKMSSSSCKNVTFSLSPTISYDITPTCLANCNRCKSSTCAFNYGYEYTEFMGIINTSSFTSNGCCDLTVSYTQCCRNRAITTGASQSIFHVESTFNACIKGENSAPRFEQIPLSISCKNRDFVFNMGARDQDKDSLSNVLADSLTYSLTTPLIKNGTSTIWTGSYSFEKPLTYDGFPKSSLTFPKGFHFDTTNGKLQFRPIKDEVALMAFKVEEFRNGVKIGEVTREFQLVIMNCPANTPPVLSNVNNSTSHLFKLVACPGVETCFYIKVDEKDLKDSLHYSYTTNIPGLANKGTTFLPNGDSIEVCLTPDSVTPHGLYFLDLAIEDNACPISGKASQRILLEVGNTEKGTFGLEKELIGCGTYAFTAVNSDHAIIDSVRWFLNGAFFTKTSNSVEIPIKSIGKQTIRYEIDNCVKSEFSDTFTVFKKQTYLSFDPLSDTILCQGDRMNVPFSISSSTRLKNISWKLKEGDVNHLNFNVDTIRIFINHKFNNTQKDNFKFTLTVVDHNDCTASQTYAFSVYPNSNLNQLSDLTYCENKDSFFNLPQLHSRSFWSGTDVHNDTLFYAAGQAPFTTQVFYKGQEDSFCYLDTMTFLALKKKKATWQSDTALCIGSPEITYIGLGSGTWKGDLTIDPTNGRKTFFEPSKEGEYILHYEKTAAQIANCEFSDSIIVRVSEKTNPILNPDTTLCLHTENLFLESQGQGTWSGSGIENDTEFNPSVIGSFSIVFDPADAKACLRKDSITIRVVENTNQISIVDTFSACENDGTEKSLIGNTKNGSWTGLGAISSTSILNFQPSDYQYGHYDFIYTDRDETYNCAISDTTVVEIIRIPKINISILQDKVELGQTFKIQNSGNTTYLYEWLIFGSSEGHSFDFEPEVIMDSLGVFNVKIIAVDPRTSCSDTLIQIDAIEVVDPNSIGESHYSSLIDLYPNPTSDQITIENHSNEAIHFQIYDLSGKIVKSIMLNSRQATIDLSELAKGFYQAQFNLGKSRWMEKLVRK